jgi:hypothetical protein
MRGLGLRNEALQLGKQGHELQSRNFRPCTLLGAVCTELGSFLEGHDWYAKAEKRGAGKQSIDTELRGIFLRADKARRETMRASLLAKDSNRYRWVNDRSIAVNRCHFLRQSQASLSGRKLPSSDGCIWPVSASSHLFVWDNRVENGKGPVYLSR